MSGWARLAQTMTWPGLYEGLLRVIGGASDAYPSCFEAFTELQVMDPETAESRGIDVAVAAELVGDYRIASALALRLFVTAAARPTGCGSPAGFAPPPDSRPQLATRSRRCARGLAQIKSKLTSAYGTCRSCNDSTSHSSNSAPPLSGPRPHARSPKEHPGQ
jgi:hypothetical protein